MLLSAANHTTPALSAKTFVVKSCLPNFCSQKWGRYCTCLAAANAVVWSRDDGISISRLFARTYVNKQVLGGEKNRTKWEAWMKASTFSKEEAMARYVSVALSVVKSRGEEAGRLGQHTTSGAVSYRT